MNLQNVGILENKKCGHYLLLFANETEKKQKQMIFKSVYKHDLHINTHRTFLSSALVKSNPMAVVNLVSHINQHVSMLATQVVEKALVEEAEKLRKEFGENIPPEQIMELQAKRQALIAEQILKITESMVQEEAEAMQDSNMDPLVLLKQQELALRQQDQELKAQVQGEQQGLKEQQFEYKQDLDAMKLQKDYDLAELRARIAQQRTNATKQEG